SGHVEIVGHGEGAVTAWFSSQLVLARVLAPYPNIIEPTDSLAEESFIDTLVNEKLKQLRLKQSPTAGDAEFLRRAYLDTIGTLPSPEETRRFLESTFPTKRERLVDHLLARKEFVDYWTYKWSDILLINGRVLRPDAIKSYYGWVRNHVRQNTPWDEFVTEVVTARGNSLENGATNFYAVHQDPETMAENVSQAFLSLSINCAKCHNHPLEKWTNDQYYAFANLFSRVQAKGWASDTRSGDGRRVLYVEKRGELIQPRTGQPQPPAPLDGEPIAFDDPDDRREKLATWLTSPDNPYFSRAITNRIWANFFGVGLVEPVDDLRVSNPASNETLLSAAAHFLVENQYDVKTLMRAILNSKTYQRSSEPLTENLGDSRYYSRYYPKRLMAEVLHDAIADVTGVPSDFNAIAFPGGDVQKTNFYPEGTRAIELYDSAVASYFLKTFGRNERAITCECERSNEPSMVQVLHLSNGETINNKLQDAKARLTSWLADALPAGNLVDEAYLHAFSRFPRESEKKPIVEILDSTPPEERRQVLEDLFWALFSSREFLFNH
ncbi:MAG: DUF1549 domain-containing protein, partial [Verrucomicrobiota bacterium]